MPSLVTSGATLRCSMGSTTSTLVVPPGRGVVAGGNPVATVADHVALVNIQPFGLCASTANPGGGAGEGLGIAWPGADLAIIALAAWYILAAAASISRLRRHARHLTPQGKLVPQEAG